MFSFKKHLFVSKYNKSRHKEYHNRFHAFCLRRQGYFFLHGIHKQVKMMQASILQLFFTYTHVVKNPIGLTLIKKFST